MKAHSFFVSACIVMMTLMSLVAIPQPASASIYNFTPSTYTFSLDYNYYYPSYDPYVWTDTETYTLTLDVTIDADLSAVDVVDVYFLNDYNYDLYVAGSSITCLMKRTWVGEGSNEFTLADFVPVQNASYWVVIDNTNTYSADTPPVTHVSGTFSLSYVQTSSLYDLSGRVSGEHGGLNGVTVRLSPGSHSTTTNSNGDYYFYSIPSGTYTITATCSGYRSSTETVTVYGDKSWNIMLTPEKTSPGGISGLTLGIIGGIAAVAVVLVIVFLVIRKKSRAKAPLPEPPQGSINPEAPPVTFSQSPIGPDVSITQPPPQPVLPQEWTPSGSLAYPQQSPPQGSQLQAAQQQPQVDASPPPQPASAAVFCQSCGSAVTGFGKFCKNCGSPIK